MATHLLDLNSSNFVCAIPSRNPSSLCNGRKYCHPRIKCIQQTLDVIETDVARRSANYEPPICDIGFIQSIKNKYGEAGYLERAENLKYYARSLLEEEKDTARGSLELVDTLQQLGLSHHFVDDINRVIEEVSVHQNKEHDLLYTALKFRILRQNGRMIPEDVFSPFLDKNGGFKEDLTSDAKAMLSLYDASYLGMDGETLMDKAKTFTTKHLKDHWINGNLELELHNLVERGLKIPYHWRTPRLDARWCIQNYAASKKKNPKLLELARLDYNICQAGYLNNVKAMSSWWNERGLAKQLPYSRDRLPECFIWGQGIVADPKYGYATEMLTLINQIITTVDDTYDVYGTIQELELFTSAVERWDLKALEELPQYMRRCYMVIFNFTNEMAYTTLKMQGNNIVPYLSKFWADLCKAYLQEAKWFYEGHKPTFDEYMNNAWITISGPLILSCAFFLMNHEITKERLVLLDSYPDLIRTSSYAFRLLDDLGTANDELARGDVLKAVQCHMQEKGVSEQASREYVKYEISESWKKLNRHFILGSKFPRALVVSSMDVLRISHWYYANGDGFGSQRERTFEFSSLLRSSQLMGWHMNSSNRTTWKAFIFELAAYYILIND